MEIHYGFEHFEIQTDSKGVVSCERSGSCFRRCDLRRIEYPIAELSEVHATAFVRHQAAENAKAFMIQLVVSIGWLVASLTLLAVSYSEMN